MFDELVIASHNQGKVREIGDLLAPFGVRVFSSGELGLPEPVEDGDSFVANALIKSKSAAEHSGKTALADDSGLEVEALDGAPGIFSARWAGGQKDFTHAMQRVKEELVSRAEEPDGALARFVCVLSLTAPDGFTAHFEGEVHGKLTFPPKGDQGFGYDPIFIPDGHEQTFAQMEPEQKHQMSHRAKAFRKFETWIKEQQLREGA